VVPLGVDEVFAPLGLRAPVLPYVLFVGQRAGYKNFRAVLQALGRLADLELICVGGGPMRAEELAAAPASVRARVRHLGLVPETELNELYNRAVCLIYPSSYEGFGIPVLEAMRAGCPVVCSDCRAVLEVGRDALTVASGLDADSLARAIERTAEPAYRAAIIQAGLGVAQTYSWERTYQQTLRIYRDLASID
jgi:mannosyltransferase